jgi:hypothetical protein
MGGNAVGTLYVCASPLTIETIFNSKLARYSVTDQILRFLPRTAGAFAHRWSFSKQTPITIAQTTSLDMFLLLAAMAFLMKPQFGFIGICRPTISVGW